MTIDQYIAMAVLSSLVLVFANSCFFAPKVDTWGRWFAWYPVKIRNRYTWLKLVERRKCFTGSSSETSVNWIEYRNAISPKTSLH